MEAEGEVAHDDDFSEDDSSDDGDRWVGNEAQSSLLIILQHARDIGFNSMYSWNNGGVFYNCRSVERT